MSLIQKESKIEEYAENLENLYDFMVFQDMYEKWLEEQYLRNYQEERIEKELEIELNSY